MEYAFAFIVLSQAVPSYLKTGGVHFDLDQIGMLLSIGIFGILVAISELKKSRPRIDIVLDKIDEIKADSKQIIRYLERLNGD